VALPQKPGALVFFRLRTSATHETFEFKDIGAAVPNRGPKDDPVNIFGLTYVQTVDEISPDDGKLNPIHIETGMFLNVPASVSPPLPAGFTRLSTIPHGDSIIASGLMQNKPDIPGPFIVNSPILPTFVNGTVPMNSNVLGVYTMTEKALPKNVALTTFLNPNSLLIEANKDIKILSTSTFIMSTDAADGGGK
jgi:hypothetical protein